VLTKHSKAKHLTMETFYDKRIRPVKAALPNG